MALRAGSVGLGCEAGLGSSRGWGSSRPVALPLPPPETRWPARLALGGGLRSLFSSFPSASRRPASGAVAAALPPSPGGGVVRPRRRGGCARAAGQGTAGGAWAVSSRVVGRCPTPRGGRTGGGDRVRRSAAATLDARRALLADLPSYGARRDPRSRGGHPGGSPRLAPSS